MSLGKGKDTTPVGVNPSNKDPLQSSPTRQFNISVVGLSGTEKEKGAVGVGKSCLCNRFVRPLEDDYFTDHISTLSQVDFGGRVINNDHWLYWGERQLTGDDGVDMQFRIVEQTEFLDDESFQPIKSNNKEPYIKRCAAVKLHSPDKLMYIWKNQLALEHDYEQRVLPDGRVSIDGFICVFDVSAALSRTAEQQVDAVLQILININKAKKPVVIVTTKNDESEPRLVKEVDRLLSRKELKGSPLPPVVESSAHQNVNVDLGFTVLAQLIDSKSRAKPRLLPYIDAARSRKEILEVAQAAYVNKLRQFVSDHRVPWSHVVKQLGGDPDFEHFCELCGRSAAQKLYRSQQRELKQKFMEKKLAGHLQRLPEVFDQLLPDLQFVQNRSWNEMIAFLPTLPSFSRFFLPPGSFAATVDSWPDSTGVQQDSNKIPSEVFYTSEAESAYKRHQSSLETESKRAKLQEEFAQLLQNCPQVTPGKPLGDVRIFLLGQPAFEALPESDIQSIYDRFQRQRVKEARREFSELLLENVDEFVGRILLRPESNGTGSSGRSGTVPGLNETDMLAIHEKLQEDGRYRQLNRLHRQRDNLICQHVGFISYPLRQHCPAQPRCADELVENLIANRIPPRPSYPHWTNQSRDQWAFEGPNRSDFVDMVILGSNGLADRIADEIGNYIPTGQYEFDNQTYQLSYKAANCDNSASLGANWNSSINGLIGVFSSRRSFDSLREFLTHSLNSTSIPIVLVSACDPSHLDDLPHLQQQAANLAQSFNWAFVGVSGSDSQERSRNFGGTGGGHADLVSPYRIQRCLDELISRQNEYGRLLDNSNRGEQQDLRILICLMCGDDFSPQLILNPMMDQCESPRHQADNAGMGRTVVIETFVPSAGRKVRFSVTTAAYHTALVWVADGNYYHGYILAYSTRRKASLYHLDCLAHLIPDPIPILMVAVGEVTEFFSDLATNQLITEGNEIADKIAARFITVSKATDQSISIYSAFFQEVWQKQQKSTAFQAPILSQLQQSTDRKVISPELIGNGSNFALHFHTGWPPAAPEDSDENCGDEMVPISSFLHATGADGDEATVHSSFSPAHSLHLRSKGSRDSAIGGSEEIWTADGNGESRHRPNLPARLTSTNSQSAANMSKSYPDPLNSSLSEVISSSSTASGDNLSDESNLTQQQQLVKSASLLKKAKSEVSTTEGWLDTSGSESNTPVSTHSSKFKPGRLNLTQYANVTEAIGRQKTLTTVGHHSAPSISPAPLATPEHIEMVNSTEEPTGLTDSNTDPMQRSVKFTTEDDMTSDSSLKYSYERFGRRPTPHKRAVKGKFGSAKDRIQQLNRTFGDDSNSAELSQSPTPPPVPAYSRDRYFPRLNNSNQSQTDAVQADRVLSRLRSASQDSLDLPPSPTSDFWSSGSTFVRRVATSFRFGHNSKNAAESKSLPQSPIIGYQGRLANDKLSPRHSNTLAASGFFLLPPPFAAQSYCTDGTLSKDSSYDTEENSSPRGNEWLNESTKGTPKGGSTVQKSPKKEENKKDRKTSRFIKSSTSNNTAGATNTTVTPESSKSSGFSLSSRSRSKKTTKESQSTAIPSGPKNLQELSAGQKDSVPLFVRKCVDFVEAEGLNAEGIYRVPGNQVQVALLEQKFIEDPHVDFAHLDIPVNAVATALKNFFATLSEPVVPTGFYEEIITTMDLSDKKLRLEQLRSILACLPTENFELLKYFLNHLRKVAQHSFETSMDQRNLAKCWWPTLLRPHFDTFELMAQMTAKLEEFVQLMLEHFDFFFILNTSNTGRS